MALVRAALKPSLINGVRCYDPVFKPSVKKNKSTVFNFTSNRVYKELLASFDKPPPMHSFLIPKWKLIRQKQAECSLDVGLPSFKRFPVDATIYRVMWYFCLVNLLLAEYKAYILIQNANYGTPPPPFLNF